MILYDIYVLQLGFHSVATVGKIYNNRRETVMYTNGRNNAENNAKKHRIHKIENKHGKYEGWNFNFGNDAVTFDTAHLQSSYFHRPSMYSPELCRTRSQR